MLREMLIGREVADVVVERFEDDSGEHDRVIVTLDNDSVVTLISHDAEGYSSTIVVSGSTPVG